MHSFLILPRQHRDEMIRHVQAQVPLEACGLMVGREARVESTLPISNIEQSPVRFRMDPVEQLRAFEWIDARGLDLLGIYHSHPAGPETVSPTDIAEAAYELAHVILSRNSTGAWTMHAFHIEDGRAQEVQLQLE